MTDVTGASGTRDFTGFWHRAGTRAVVMVVIFAIVFVVTGVFGSWVFAPAVGWIAAAGTFTIWIWLSVLRFDAADTAAHASREDPSQRMAQTLLLLASIASFGAIALLLVEAGSLAASATLGLIATALATLAASWWLVHTVYTLRYAGFYYRAGGTGIEFNQKESPRYLDFAYLAFTLGMTFQVSDTNITNSTLRAEALRHALLSFLLGVVVVASTINLVSSLLH
ncbi:DUF1345 domain-containing protein [Agreia sp.]|uniref:DUF1345 domain-containing protein n=1 Tax=Agreia sp. TaxID=1872416 RepID=UPI0035BC8507